MSRPARHLILFCAAFFLLVFAGTAVSMERADHGHFVYALDDAYIHLALAEQLAHGHYGINATEFSSPSSSLLWPFLLLPFAGTSVQSYLPLFWNAIFGTLAACLIGYAVARWPPQVDRQGQMPFYKQAIVAVLLLFTANLFGLALIGMEHLLQVLLAIACAIGMAEALSERPIPAWCVAAAILAPSVRYEDFALTAALCVALLGARRGKAALLTFAAALAPLAGFSLFLRSKGLPLLPLSVLVKGGAYQHASVLSKAFAVVHGNLIDAILNPDHYSLVILFLIFCWLTGREKGRARRFVFAGATLLAALQLAIGRFGWFHRYEVYAVIFLVLILLRMLAQQRSVSFPYLVIGLLFCAAPYLLATVELPRVSQEIYDQQYQMHRFLTEFYRGNFAVNDLGLASFQRTPGTYVLDLAGLASADSAAETAKPASWMAATAIRHDAALAIVFPEWYRIPPTWTPVARLCNPRPPIIAAYPCVVFYSTTAERTAEIRTDLQRFAPTLPPEDRLDF